MKDRDAKMTDIKLYSGILYQYVLDKKIGLQDAYNLARSQIEMVSEYKGRGTRNKNLPTLDKVIVGIMKSHRPELNELLDAIKKQFVFTFDDKLKDYLEK